jgi:hypothetical protein
MPRAFEPKSTNPALGQIVRLHADIGGKILENKKLAARLATDMMHVEAVKDVGDITVPLRMSQKALRND